MTKLFVTVKENNAKFETPLKTVVIEEIKELNMELFDSMIDDCWSTITVIVDQHCKNNLMKAVINGFLNEYKFPHQEIVWE